MLIGLTAVSYTHLEEIGMEDKTVGVCPVGCAVFAYRYLDIDWQEAAHRCV